MRILGFDTATRATAVALCELGGEEGERGAQPSGGRLGGGETKIELRDDPPRGERPRHATRLLPLVAEALDRARLGWEDVDRIAVGVGPGTFTGLRIGVASARALGSARGIPLAGVSTLRSLALGALAATGHGLEARAETVVAVLDARRREVFAAGWRVEATVGGTELGTPSLAPRALAPDGLARAIGELRGRVLAIGEGAVEFREVLERSGASVPEYGSRLHQVSAVNHCRLARWLPSSAPGQIHPEYLRLPDAELALRAARSR